MARKKTKASTGRTEPIEFIILGEPASKGNSRTFTKRGGIPRLIKSKKALNYLDAFYVQCPRLDELFEGDVHAEITIHYASRRPDLDESVILDAMQGRIYKNDRQVRKKTVQWGLDRINPRTEIRIAPLESGVGASDS